MSRLFASLAIVAMAFAPTVARAQDAAKKDATAELLAKLLGDEIKTRSARNLVQSRAFSEMLKTALNASEDACAPVLIK